MYFCNVTKYQDYHFYLKYGKALISNIYSVAYSYLLSVF